MVCYVIQPAENLQRWPCHYLHECWIMTVIPATPGTQYHSPPSLSLIQTDHHLSFADSCSYLTSPHLTTPQDKTRQGMQYPPHPHTAAWHTHLAQFQRPKQDFYDLPTIIVFILAILLVCTAINQAFQTPRSLPQRFLKFVSLLLAPSFAFVMRSVWRGLPLPQAVRVVSSWLWGVWSQGGGDSRASAYCALVMIVVLLDGELVAIEAMSASELERAMGC